MQTWEYCKVDEAKGRLVQYKLGGSKVSTLDTRNLPEMVIARLGNHGWEAYQVKNGVWFFKRLLAESSE